jgi:hypothetical protein
MMRRVIVLLFLAAVVPTAAQDRANVTTVNAVDPWFGTFSIIAFDPATNELGVATQSRAFGAGAAVPYAIPGVGAIATQANANRSYGPKAIAMLQQGVAPEEIVKRLSAQDEGRDWNFHRQARHRSQLRSKGSHSPGRLCRARGRHQLRRRRQHIGQ